MGEFLATGSAIVTIVAAALHSARLLHDDFKKIKSARENIKPVVDDLDSVVGILSSLETAARDPSVPKETLDMIESGDVKAATENCNKVCKGFRDKLRRWMKHSTDDRLDWRDRFRVGFLGEKDVVEFGAQLLACKRTFTITLQMAEIFSRQSQRTNAIIKMLDDKEETINQESAFVISRINDINLQLERMRVKTQLPEEETNETTSGPDHLESLSIFENVADSARAEIASCRIRIGKVSQGKDARALVGVHGFDVGEGRMNVDIGDVTVGDRSKAAVGRTKGLDLNAFFK